MKFNFTGENILLTEAMKEYVEEHLSSISKYFKEPTQIDIKLSVKKDKDIIKIKSLAFKGNKLVVRAEEKTSDFYKGIIKLKQKLVRQLKALKIKFKDENKDWLKFKKYEEEQSPQVIIKTKYVDKDELTYTEAVNKLEALGYDFLLFIDTDLNIPCVIYKNKNKKDEYGVIRMEDN